MLTSLGALCGFTNGLSLFLRLMEKIAFDRCEQIILITRLEPVLYTLALSVYFCLACTITNFSFNFLIFILVGLNILSYMNYFLTKKSFYILLRIRARV